MRIKNINGTSQTECVCGSWLQHWKNFSGQRPACCPATGCHNTDLVGAHVQKADGLDDKWYIYPLCKSHNQSKGVLTVSDAYQLVPANKQETCEKQR
jgi:hypothetical protein